MKIPFAGKRRDLILGDMPPSIHMSQNRGFPETFIGDSPIRAPRSFLAGRESGNMDAMTGKGTSMGLPQEKARYTVEDYMQWPDEIRCELINGEIWDMSPAPTLDHQALLSSLHVEIALALRERNKDGGGGGVLTCKVLESPVDVVLDFDTVVQPDLIVVCDPAKLANHKNVQGAPDLVVEVLSPSTAARDKREKKALYERAGVPQYLIVDPVSRYAELFTLLLGAYGIPQILAAEDSLALNLLPERVFPLGELFGWPMPHQAGAA